MRRLYDSVYHLRRLLISNVFLVDGGPGNRWIVDSGHWLERAPLLREIKRTGLAPRDVTGVLLTHRHSDHAGNARWLRERFGVKVHAHRRDAEILDGTRPRPYMDPKGARADVRLLVAFENRWPSRTPVDRALDEGDVVAGLEVHHTPGHTDGSVFYRDAKTGTLMTGDSLLTAIPPLVRRTGLALAYPIFSSDRERAIASVLAFHRAGHAYQNLLAGHGVPMIGDARARVLEYLQKSGY